MGMAQGVGSQSHEEHGLECHLGGAMGVVDAMGVEDAIDVEDATDVWDAMGVADAMDVLL